MVLTCVLLTCLASSSGPSFHACNQGKADSVAKITAKMIELGVQDTLGLCVNYMHALPTSYMERIEETDEVERIQCFKALIADNQDKKNIDTFWSFECRCTKPHVLGCYGFCACHPKMHCREGSSGKHHSVRVHV